MSKMQKIKTLPKKNKDHHRKKSVLGTGKKRKFKHLVFSILGIYLIGGVLLGAMLFNAGREGIIDASPSFASVVTSLRFVDEKDYRIGDTITIAATLQNTSINESVNELSLTLLSTKDMIEWKEAVNPNSRRAEKPEINKNIISLPLISAGERVQYEISGVLKDDSSDFLTILGVLNYTNLIGNQKYETNRIFTELNSTGLVQDQVYGLDIPQTVFSLEEEVVLSLDLPKLEEENQETRSNGSIYISNKNTREVVKIQDCLLETRDECSLKISNLPVGNYTALFISEDKNNFSQIQSFKVVGNQNQGELIPSEQAEIIKPFQGASINGYFPIIIDRVISRNESLNSPPCIFQIIKDEELINEVEANINADRSCRTMISEELLEESEAGGLYTVRLKNSNLSAEFSFVSNTSTLEIETRTNLPQKGQAISIEIPRINNEENEPIQEENLNLFIYHKNSGKLENIRNLNGNPLQVKEGRFEAVIPAEYFQEGGQYLIWVRLETGRLSQFLSLIFTNSELGLARSGVKVEDYSNLRIDRDLNFSIEGVMDKDGNIVESGDCTADIYGLNTGLSPIKLEGEIIEGTCQVMLGQGKISKNGPVLVNFNTSSGNSIPQSRVFQLRAGRANNFGEINFEFEPVRKSYVNQIIVGPVVDRYGNLTDSSDKKLSFTNLKNDEVKLISDVDIINGYAEVVVPSSFLDAQELKIQLIQKTENEDMVLLEREITTETENLEQKLILPSIPSEIKHNEGLTVGISGINNTDVDRCEIKFIKNLEEFLTETAFYSFDKGGCKADWNINKFRDVSRALVQFKIGDLKFSQLVNLETGEPANNFTVAPQVRFNEKEELEISLITSPIMDRHGNLVKEGEVTWQYNGRIKQTKIKDGFARLEILASDLEARDISRRLDKRFLDLDLDVQADIVSISKNNNINIFLGGFEIANNRQTFEIQQGSNYITQGDTRILAFKVNSCQAVLINGIEQNKVLNTHWQAGICYIEIQGENLGKNRIVFSDNGFEIGQFDLRIGTTRQPVKWCKSDSKKCEQIQVVAPITSPITAIIYDGENQWKFNTEDLENTIKISQNGLNPLREYLVEISYKNLNGHEIKHYRQILGERLIGG